MLALLEHEVTMVGGAYSFCDTDSMGIVADEHGGLIACPGGRERLPSCEEAVRVLSWRQVRDIVDRFDELHPYDRSRVPQSILKLEDENFDEEGRQRPLWCYSISAKRYVLLSAPSPDHRDHPRHSLRVEDLAKVLESALGVFLNPMDPDDSSTGWIDEFWLHLLDRESGQEGSGPAWLDRPALTRVTASSPAVLSWFAGINAGCTYGEQVKPGNFVLLAHPDPLDPSGLLPFAPFERDASKWEDMQWFDRASGKRIGISTAALVGEELPAVVRVRTYRDVLIDYQGHPESKSLGPTGDRVDKWTKGLLRRRPVEALMPLHHLGKEANKLDDRVSGVALDYDDYQTEYHDPRQDEWATLVVPVLATMARAQLAERAGVNRRSIERYIAGQARPRTAHRRLLTTIAVDHAASSLREWGLVPSPDSQVTLHHYIQLWPKHWVSCRGCGRALGGRQRIWCCEACRSRARPA